MILWLSVHELILFIVNHAFTVSIKHATIKLVNVIVIPKLMLALRLIQKVVEQIVLAEELPPVFNVKLIRRFVFSNHRKHYVIIVEVVLHW